MSPLPDDEVRRRMEAVRDRILANTRAARASKAPGKVMPKPASDALAPPAPWQDREPGDDREP